MEHKTAYGVFVQACWAQHKRLLPDDQIRQEIENFNKQGLIPIHFRMLTKIFTKIVNENIKWKVFNQSVHSVVDTSLIF